MKAENKIFIKTALTTGFIYAVLMAGFDYSEGKEFSILKFLLLFFFFGLAMGLLARYNHKKKLKKERNKTDITKTEDN